ncbi:hypothetical protein UY3_05965 [Chelonia mydas]|uniref:Uncharacterized protein n=1 Tax=Chelonia mydas TaxID=8469 RepID=M7BG52_CHEMY|nr:hypothetical protein UY3_05965 [Chelonia mydas]
MGPKINPSNFSKPTTTRIPHQDVPAILSHQLIQVPARANPARSGGQYVPQPAPLAAAPIGLEQRTAASGSHDRPNLRMRQRKEETQMPDSPSKAQFLTLSRKLFKEH